MSLICNVISSEMRDPMQEQSISKKDNGSLLSHALTQVYWRMPCEQRRPFTLCDKTDCSLKFIILLSLIFLSFFTPAQANVFDWRLWDADGKLKAEKFSEAKDLYLKIQVSEPDNARLNYNLGVANYREGSMTQALNSFQLASVQTEDKDLQEKAFYNLGNSQFQLQDYESAITSYEFALEIYPDDEDAQHNLELAKKKLEEQKQDDQKQDDQNKDDENDDQDKDGENDQENDKDQDKDDQEKDQDKDDQRDKQNKPKPQNQPQNQPKKQDQTKPGGLSQQDIERMLMQVEEADPSEVNQNRTEAQGSAPSKQLRPW